jgi:tetratricopeptide (TPR) repeat protein
VYLLLAGFTVFIAGRIIKNLRSDHYTISAFEQLKNNQVDSAMLYFKHAYHCNNENIDAIFRYGNLLTMKAPTKAIEFHKLVVQHYPSPHLYMNLAKSYAGVHQYDSALKYYLSSYHIAPSRIQPLYLIANNFYDQHKQEKGDSVAQLVINTIPKINSPAVILMKEQLKTKLKH